MRAVVLLAFVVLLLIPSLATSESISIISKPSAGLTGTTSFNLHEDGKMTVLQYKSPTNIVEETINIDPEKKSEIANIAHEVLDEVFTKKDHSLWPVKKETFSVAITADKVTRSISTKRHSDKITDLMNLLRGYFP